MSHTSYLYGVEAGSRLRVLGMTIRKIRVQGFNFKPTSLIWFCSGSVAVITSGLDSYSSFESKTLYKQTE